MNKKEFKELYNKCFGKNKDDRYHAIAMLSIYGVFILILVIMIRLSPIATSDDKTNKDNNQDKTPITDKNNNSTDNNSTDDNSSQSDDIQSSDVNYSYVYTIDNSGIKEVVTGKKVDDKEIFTLITSSGSKDYARLSNNYLEKVEGNYHLIDSPSNNLIYTEINTIISLTECGILTKNDNVYTYVIPTTETLKAFNNVAEVSSDLTDTIVVTTENNLIKSININFNNYRTAINNNNPTNLNISMEFNNLGTTKDFDITVSN